MTKLTCKPSSRARSTPVAEWLLRSKSPHAGDLRAMETRLSAQMDALEAKMSELMGDAVHRVTLPASDDAGSTRGQERFKEDDAAARAGHAQRGQTPRGRRRGRC